MAKRRWAGITAVVVLAAGGVLSLTGCGAGGGEPSIDLNLPTFDDPENGAQWKPKVRNDSGDMLTDVEFTANIEVAGDDEPPVALPDRLAGVEDMCMDTPDSEPSADCLSSKKELERDACEVPHRDERVESGLSMSCDNDLKPGVNSYDAMFVIADIRLPMEHEKLRDHPDVTIHAELSVGGKVVDTAEDELSIEVPAEYDRVTLDGLPRDMSIDDPASKTHDWSVTVANDTGEDITGAGIDLEMVSNIDLFEIDPADGDCENVSSSIKEAVECADVDIPAGESVTVKLRLSVADGAAKRYEERCYPDRPSLEECRDEVSGADLRIAVKTGSELFAESGAVCRVRVDD